MNYTYKEEQTIDEIMTEKMREINEELTSREFINLSKKKQLQEKAEIYRGIVYKSRINRHIERMD